MQAGSSFAARTARANGLSFSWIELGSGPLALALHGFPDLPRTFRHQMAALAQAGWRVVAPYMRGYYPTEAPAHISYERAALTQDALALIDLLSDQPAVLIGHDWGAAAAYGAALPAPGRIARLITLAVPCSEVWWNAFITNPAQQRRSWYIFFFQMPMAEKAVAHGDFDFLERLWQEWSPGWAYPPEELQAVKDTFRHPGCSARRSTTTGMASTRPKTGPTRRPSARSRASPSPCPPCTFTEPRTAGLGSKAQPACRPPSRRVSDAHHRRGRPFRAPRAAGPGQPVDPRLYPSQVAPI